MKAILLTLVGLIILGCENYPKDPMRTLDKVKGATLKVAYSENGIWVKRNNEKVGGREAEIIKKFASSINAEIDWINGAESELMPLLQEGECHIYIGGLTQSSPWSKHVAFTKPYTTAKVYIGVRNGTPVPEDIKNKKIAVRKGSSVGKYVKKKKGIPYYSESLAGNNYVAALEWEIKELGLTKTDIKIHEEKHVLAIPHGENQFLIKLEKFLDSYEKTK